MKRVCKALEDERKIAMEEGHRSGLTEGRKSGLAEGRKSGLAEGRKSGLAEGREQERKSVALQMKKEGFSDDIIARILQLTDGDDVKKIIS